MFTKKIYKALCGFNPSTFFSSEKTSFPSSEDTTNQAKTFQDIYMKKKAPCATKILKSDTKKKLGMTYLLTYLLEDLKLTYAMQK